MKTDTLEGLRREILARRQEGTRRPFSEEFRRNVLRLVRAECDAGKSIATVAQRLGICRGTLALWLAAERKRASGSFRAVEIVREPSKDPGRNGEGDRFVVRTSKGLSIEGLSLDDVSELLRRLA